MKFDSDSMKKFIKITSLIIGLALLLIMGFVFTIKKMDKEVMEMKNFSIPSYDQSQAKLLPSQFIDGERFFIKLPISETDTVLAFADSGGGISMMLPQTVEAKSLQTKQKTGLLKGSFPIKYVPFEDLVVNDKIPQPFPLRHFNIRRPISRVSEPLLLVPPLDEEIKMINESMPNMDVFLGQNFFMGKAWTIDYPNQEIWVNTPLDSSNRTKYNIQKIGFKKNGSNESVYGHASMFICVNREVIEVLFDTGATIILSEQGKEQLNTNKNTIGGSFVAASIFDKWRKEHPDWKYYEKADHHNDIIEVPKVNIYGNNVGPVLFARRADEVWSKGMIHSMDRVVKGAIGGSVLKYFKVTIDYNSELIRFEKPINKKET